MKRKRTRCQIRRDKKGRFLETTGSTKYKRAMYNGKYIQESRKVWIIHNGEIPKDMIIHHKDFNKKNDNINNLQLMTLDEHNKLHHYGRIPWNKNKKLTQIHIDKVQKARHKTIKEKWKSWYELRQEGKTYTEIAKIVNYSYNQIIEGTRKYAKEIGTLQSLNDSINYIKKKRWLKWLELRKQGKTYKEISQIFDCSDTAIRKGLKRYKQLYF